MERSEAAAILRMMATSLKEQPSQFSYSVEMVGAQSSPTVTGGQVANLVGFQVSTAGGGPGSHTVGMQVSTSIGPATIKARDEAANEHLDEIIGLLAELANEAESDEPDETSVRSRLKDLASRAAPALIIGVAANVMSASLGIG